LKPDSNNKNWAGTICSLPQIGFWQGITKRRAKIIEEKCASEISDPLHKSLENICSNAQVKWLTISEMIENEENTNCQ
jgi:hypothetical protein